MDYHRPLTEQKSQREIEKIMNGEDDSEVQLFEDNESDWEEEDNLEMERDSSDTSDDNEVNQNLSRAESEKEEESESTDDNIPLSRLVLQKQKQTPKYIIKPKSRRLKEKDGHKWSAEMPVRSRRTASRNIIHFMAGSRGKAGTYSTNAEYFLHFFTDDILDTIIRHTNEEFARKSENYADQLSTVSALSKEELLAMFAILILSAVKKDNHLNAKQMFDLTISGAFYKACMSCDRFIFLVNCLRFDNKSTRRERAKNDSFAPIREIWNAFIDICKASYTPSSYLTIDEQLLGFRGRCPFRMYIPNKPSKYGIKIVMLCDSSSKYMIDASPYLGKSTQTGGLPLASFYVKELTKSVHGSNRNITMDNWFTSVGLADELLGDEYKLTIIGTLRENKREIPPELLQLKGREPQTSMFCFDKNKTLVSYVPKKNKLLLLLSTLHEGAEVSEDKGKPAIILNYNETKSGVDTSDQLCSNMSCSRKTRRWPLCVFYGMVNAASINSYVLYCSNKIKNREKPMRRYQLMITLSNELARPWMEQRLGTKNLRRNLRQTICDILKINPQPENAAPPERKRTICFYCPSRLRRMTAMY